MSMKRLLLVATFAIHSACMLAAAPLILEWLRELDAATRQAP